jgi:hypothetical protein
MLPRLAVASETRNLILKPVVDFILSTRSSVTRCCRAGQRHHRAKHRRCGRYTRFNLMCSALFTVFLFQTKFSKHPSSLQWCGGQRLSCSSSLFYLLLPCSSSAGGASCDSTRTSCSFSSLRSIACQPRCRPSQATTTFHYIQFSRHFVKLQQVESAKKSAHFKLAVTVAVVFFSFILRTVYAVMLALSS